MITDIDIRLGREVHARIMDDLRRLREELGNGSQMKPDAASTGMACANYMGKIGGLTAALKHLQDAHDSMTGKVDKKTETRN